MSSWVDECPFSIVFVAGLSFNQPVFCPSTTWNPDGITFTNASITGLAPSGVFVARDNTLYVANRERGTVYIWPGGILGPGRNLSGSLNIPMTVFVSNVGDIYVDNGSGGSRVDRWAVNTTNSVSFMSVTSQCYAIVMDQRNTLYCAAIFDHRVVKKWIGDNSTLSTTVAGTGAAGAAANQLNYPAGLFVDLNFTLYVADCLNNRIQKFTFGQTNGETIVGNGLASSSPFTFNCPGTITFDGNGYMFFTDFYNHRLFGSGPLGLRCLFGCSTVAGSAANQLNTATRVHF